MKKKHRAAIAILIVLAVAMLSGSSQHLLAASTIQNSIKIVLMLRALKVARLVRRWSHRQLVPLFHGAALAQAHETAASW
jgi:Na+/proline symporter